MKLLEEKIRSEGRALSETVLKVDGFINHQVDPVLMSEIGKTLASYYKDKGVTKVFTIESSGIAPAVYTAMELGVPMVILKKQTSKILTGDVFQTNITSFTKGTSYELTLSQNYIQPDDVVLVIDDFLANGEAATGATRLVEMGGARIAGIAILIEKAFQRGRKRLEDNGYEVRSLARVSKLGRGLIEFPEADVEHSLKVLYLLIVYKRLNIELNRLCSGVTLSEFRIRSQIIYCEMSSSEHAIFLLISLQNVNNSSDRT